jgi:CcmD family protein
MKKFFNVLWLVNCFFFLAQGYAYAQGGSQPQMAEAFYSEGKVYVVIVVLAIVLLGMILYLFTMDRKLNKLENELKNKK